MDEEKPDRAAIERAQQVLYDEGSKLREKVFGHQYISKSKSLPEFLQPVQTMAITAGWSLVWSRPGLELKTRSLLCLAMLAMLGRDNELAAHVRGAISNGCTEKEIQEVFLQVGVYGGVPNAVNATRIASEVLQDNNKNIPNDRTSL
ncbi:4-carboxymuconolactone decarboxylase [Talaromyces proteolyticus]|uniref:4-carboxymuconolactone decarboxylase n=1 Tax=Talaromyces proteolyticus TaxID=1131652 RepID=A0AAD4PUX1_9EURO|nr:4-carboxymuconolactone decarboxylase [Talaromyces proteolyticus]KAH8695621.1 4-carboxymuconolactone decarboxylase [Talaromyces proteolyticus]